MVGDLLKIVKGPDWPWLRENVPEPNLLCVCDECILYWYAELTNLDRPMWDDRENGDFEVPEVMTAISRQLGAEVGDQ